MKIKRLNYLATGVVTAGLLFSAGHLSAQTVDSVLQQSSDATAELRNDQQKINGIASRTEKLLQEYKQVNKQIDGLKVYNAQLELQITDQRKQLITLDQSIASASTLERDIAPLMENMIDGLEKFVALDLPFNQEERTARVAKLRENLGRSALSTAEKFRQVLEAYKIELDYGNNIDAYTATVNVDGADQDVNIFRVGRIALVYQTKDQSKTAAWNKETGGWEPLDQSEWGKAISDGIKIAKKQSPINIMNIPVAAPKEASR